MQRVVPFFSENISEEALDAIVTSDSCKQVILSREQFFFQ